jgi:hypothetical protein
MNDMMTLFKDSLDVIQAGNTKGKQLITDVVISFFRQAEMPLDNEQVRSIRAITDRFYFALTSPNTLSFEKMLALRDLQVNIRRISTDVLTDPQRRFFEKIQDVQDKNIKMQMPASPYITIAAQDPVAVSAKIQDFWIQNLNLEEVVRPTIKVIGDHFVEDYQRVTQDAELLYGANALKAYYSAPYLPGKESDVYLKIERMFLELHLACQNELIRNLEPDKREGVKALKNIFKLSNIQDVAKEN